MFKKTAICLFLAAFCLGARAADTNSLVWHRATDRVDADVRGLALWPLLERIAVEAGWHIFVEPDTTHTTSAKFKDLPSGDALKMLLGNLNFALVPRTNGVPQLYVFRTERQNATLQVRAPQAAPRHVPNELLVKLKPGTDADALAKLLGAKITGRNDKLGLYRLQFGNADATDAALASLKNNPDVAAVDYNYVFDPPATPQLLANPPVGPVSLTLDPATTGDPCNPVVGLIDTQVQSLGSQLDPFMLKPISVAGDACTNTSTLTHGTAMAETILRAVSQSAGGNSSVRILAVNVYGCTDATTTSWNVALGIQAAVDNGATVLNLSLGGPGDSAVLDSVIQQAVAAGIPVYAAAGNQPVSTPTYPAADPGVIAVTATQGGQLAPYADFGSFVSLAMPGASVVYLGTQAYVVQGTSPATAYATGVAAGTKGADCLPWSQIQSAMQQKFPVPAK
ncbi:MAG: S8 family serine peptidase [Verrucomicrobiota bacterium]